MNAPIQYRYDPRWELVAFMWALAAGLPVAILAGLVPRTLGIAAGLFFACFSVLTTLRRHAFRRALVFDEEGIWLLSGFLRMQVRRVVFAEITAVWEAYLPFNATVLCFRSHGKTFEVYPLLLPDSASYQAVVRRICSRQGSTPGVAQS